MKTEPTCKCERKKKLKFAAETYATHIAQLCYVEMLYIELNPHRSRNDVI
jgi:hypothetical protein